MIGLYIFLAVLGLILFLVIFLSILNSVKNKRVMNNSPYIKDLKTINNRYTFKVIAKTSEKKTFHLNSKKAYTNFDMNKAKLSVIKDNYFYYRNLVNDIEFNIENYKKYKKEVESIYLCSDKNLAKENKMSLKSFNKRETKLAKPLYQYPPMTYTLRIAYEYTSPAGRNHYANHFDVPYPIIKAIVDQIPTGKTNKLEPKEKKSNNQPKTQENKQEHVDYEIEEVE